MGSRPRLYLSGPMSGLEDLNASAFLAAEGALREAGFRVVNPLRLRPTLTSWEANLRRDLRILLLCDGLATLPRVCASRGADLEELVARAVAIPVERWEWWGVRGWRTG